MAGGPVKEHHRQAEVPTDRPDYREGRWEKAVKVYTVNQESKYLLVQNVHALGVTDDLLQLCALYGDIEEYRLLDEYPSEPFTDVYWIKFADIDSARIAKRRLDNRSFFGKSLHVCYAPEYETVADTREKLLQRRTTIARKTREAFKSLQSGSSKPAAANKHPSTSTQVLRSAPDHTVPSPTTVRSINNSALSFTTAQTPLTTATPNSSTMDHHHIHPDHHTQSSLLALPLPLPPPPPPSSIPPPPHHHGHQPVLHYYPSAQLGPDAGASPLPPAQLNSSALTTGLGTALPQGSSISRHATNSSSTAVVEIDSGRDTDHSLERTSVSSAKVALSVKVQSGVGRGRSCDGAEDVSLFSPTGLSRAARVSAYLSSSSSSATSSPVPAASRAEAGGKGNSNSGSKLEGKTKASIQQKQPLSAARVEVAPSSNVAEPSASTLGTHRSSPTPTSAQKAPLPYHTAPQTGSRSVDRTVLAVRDRMDRVWAAAVTTGEPPKPKKRRRI